MKMLFILVNIFLVIFVIYNGSSTIFDIINNKDVWTSTVYPNANEQSIFQSGGNYRSLEMCQEKSNELLVNLNATEVGSFECGLNCEETEDGVTPSICEETSH